MFKRSLHGTALLLLAASCVPAPRAAVPRATAPPAMTSAASLPAPSIELPTDGDPLPAPPFLNPARTSDDAGRGLECLTAAVYYEARSEPLDGQRAVAQVVLNRVRNPAFPSSICGVVYQGSFRATGCQFSFTCDGSLTYRREPAAWERARLVAQAALAGSVYTPVGPATFYHTTAILPWWASSMERVATVGAHIFYRWAGSLGGAFAYRQHYSGVEPDATQEAADHSSDRALVQYAVDNYAGVTVRRGTATASAGGVSEPRAEPTGPVHVHLGAAAASREVSPLETEASVTIHRGPVPAPAPAPAVPG